VYTAVVPKSSLNPKVDEYFAKAPLFAQPILIHLRELIHKGCPDVTEEMKWSRPFFLHNGTILCNISAFKAHCAFGFWGAEIGRILVEEGAVKEGGMGSLGKVTSVRELPPDKRFIGYILQAASLIDSGQGENRIAAARRVVKAPKPAPVVPAEFTVALKKSKAAAIAYAAFSPSCQREYVQWIAEAKRPETRDRRIEQAVEWIAKGKQRNWKYQDC
jgi:uncharacterized protein YdeI (YjbR/CyaY-like superfamily)